MKNTESSVCQVSTRLATIDKCVGDGAQIDIFKFTSSRYASGQPRDAQASLLQHFSNDGLVQEVILATNFTGEGEATAHVIAEMLKKRGLRVTRLARGVPAGSELEYVDLGTIAHALVDRR